jgi:dihydroorotate dehydrogenase (NAD+) catalytic subunit
VGVGTATFLDPRAPLRIAAELVAWCAEHGVARVADLTGALETGHA